MLSTIRVNVEINGKSRQRPLRIFDAKTNKFGVVVAGAVLPVTVTGADRVKLDRKDGGKDPETCRAAKLADIGIEAKPRRDAIDPKIAAFADLASKVDAETLNAMMAFLTAKVAK